VISLIPLLRNMVAELSFIDDAARNYRDPGIHDADIACSVKPAQRVRLTIALGEHRVHRLRPYRGPHCALMGHSSCFTVVHVSQFTSSRELNRRDSHAVAY